MFANAMKKNFDQDRRYATIVRQADGRIIVSPKGIFGGSFYLTEDQIESYLAWDSDRFKNTFRFSRTISVFSLLAVIFMLSEFPEYVGLFVVGVCALAYALTKMGRQRSFDEEFPDSLPTRDRDKLCRAANVRLVRMSPGMCVVGTVFFWWMTWSMVGELVAHIAEYSALNIFNYVLIGGFSLNLAAFSTYLAFEHFRFRRRHGCAPSKDYISPPV
jgi:hypothetical protein